MSSEPELEPVGANAPRSRGRELVQGISLGALALLQIVVAFATQWYVMVLLGPGGETDAFFAAVTIPTFLTTVVLGSFSQVLMPYLAGRERGTARREALAAMFAALAVASAAAFVLAITVKLWAWLVFPGFAPSVAALLQQLSLVNLAAMISTAGAQVLWCYRHSQTQHVRADGSALIAALVYLILLTSILPRYGLVAAASMAIVRGVVQIVVLLVGVPLADFANCRAHFASLKVVFARCRALIAGASYYKLDPVIDRMLSSMGVPGSLSLLYFAQQLAAAVAQVLSGAIASPAVPPVSKAIAAGDGATVRRLVLRRVLLVIAIISSGYLVLLLGGGRLLGMILATGGVNVADVNRIWLLLLLFGGYVLGGAAGQITSSTLYAMGETRATTILSVIAFSLFVPVKFVAFRFFDLEGLAVTVSLFFLTNLVGQSILIARKLHGLRHGPETRPE